MPFSLAIVGRPNVGKSTLFNRLIGKKMAIVDDTPGVTRDWRCEAADLMGLEFDVIDTAGLEDSFDQSMEGRMRQQTESALGHADAVLFMIDARAGVTPLDEHFALWLRKQKIPTILCANKCEGKASDPGLYEAYGLGFGEPIALSSEHALGMSDLYEAVQPLVQAYEEEHGLDAEEEEEDDFWSEEDDADIALPFNEGEGVGFGDQEDEEIAPEDVKPIKVAFVGRPNVGKSTLLNALLEEQRVMTGPEPGVTRDAVAVDWEFRGHKFRLVDTAGMRRKAKVVDRIERMSVSETLRNIRLAQVVVMMLDSNAIFDKQDLQIASQVIEEGRALVVAVNKWDIVEEREESMKRLKDKLDLSLSQVKNIPTVMISAKTGRKLNRLMEMILETHDMWNKRVATSPLNNWLREMQAHHPPPLTQGRPNKMRYITQIKARPPTFALWVSRPHDIPHSYRRYLMNGMREDFNIPGVPIRMMLRTSKNPYHNG